MFHFANAAFTPDTYMCIMEVWCQWHYSHVKCVSWRLKYITTRLFVQQIIPAHNDGYAKALCHFCEGNPSKTGSLLTQRASNAEIVLMLWHHLALRWRHNGHDGVSNHQHHRCLLNRLFGCRSKKTSKLRVTGFCAGNSPGEFPAQMASNAENVSIW